MIGGEEKTPRCSGGLNPVSLQPSGAVDGVVLSWPRAWDCGRPVVTHPSLHLCLLLTQGLFGVLAVPSHGRVRSPPVPVHRAF